MKAKQENKEPNLTLDVPKPSEKERQVAIKKLTDISRASAWHVHRWPLQKKCVEYRTRMHLPRTYLARGGVDVRGISEGMDLNQFVFEHYMELKEGKADGVKAVNYVHADDVVSRRHEYLGPDPRIAGYFFDNYGEVHIRWWDGFLKDQWMDQQKWKLSVKVDGSGQWVVKED